MDRQSRAWVAAIYDSNKKEGQRPTETQLPRVFITPPPLRPAPVAVRHPLLQDRQDAPLDPDPSDPLAGASSTLSSSISTSVSNSVSSSLSSSAVKELQAASSRFTATLSTFSLSSSAAVKSARDNGVQDGAASAAASARTSASSVIASATAQAAIALSQAASISSSASLMLAAMTGGASAISSIQESANSAVDAAQSSASSSAESAVNAARASALAAMENNPDGSQAQVSGIPPGQLVGIVVGTAIASSVLSILFTLFIVRYRRRKAAEAEGTIAFDPDPRQPDRPVFSGGQDNVFAFPNYTAAMKLHHQKVPSNSFPPDVKQGQPSPAKTRPVRISITGGRPLPSVPSTTPSEPATAIPYTPGTDNPERGVGEPGFGLGLYSSDTEHDPQSPFTISTTSAQRDTRGDLTPMMKFSLARTQSMDGRQRMQLVRVGSQKDSIHRLFSQEATPPNTGRRVNRDSKTEEHYEAEADRETTASAEESQYQLPSLSDVGSLGMNPMKFGRRTESSLASSFSTSSSNHSAGKDSNHAPRREPLRPRSSPAAPGRTTSEHMTAMLMESYPPPPPPPSVPPMPLSPPVQEQPVSRFSPYSTPTRSSMSMSLPATSPPPPQMPPLPSPLRIPSLQSPVPRRPNLAAGVISLDQQLQPQQRGRPPLPPPFQLPRPQTQTQMQMQMQQARPRTAPKPGASTASFSLFPRD
ncbi:hypothetical protein F5X99DRAFT_414260 [Biscogniauxia marginata]|nr:hypothetical protein F5X99DRAFT_414260 [Biscogniauxia marginata]